MRVYKLFYSIFIISFLTSCSFIINNKDLPSSSHIPTPSSFSLMEELKGTIWKLSENDYSQNTFLFFHSRENTYAIVYLQESSSLENYPESYQYKKFGRKQVITSSILKNNNSAVYQSYTSVHQYLGLYLLNSGLKLYFASGLNPQSIADALESRSAPAWDLYRY